MSKSKESALIDYIATLYKSVATHATFENMSVSEHIEIALSVARVSLLVSPPADGVKVEFAHNKDSAIEADNKLSEKQFEKVASDEPKIIFGTLEARKKVADGRFTKYVITVDGKEYFTFSDDLRDDVRKLTNDTVVKLTLHAKTQGEFIAIAAHGEQPEF